MNAIAWARWSGAAPVLALVLAVSGCTTYKTQNRLYAPWVAGDLPAAERFSRVKSEKEASGKDGILWKLEHAAILRAAGKYAESNQAFYEAEERMDRYAQQARVSVSRETFALISNPQNLPYRGRSYDGIMLNTYKALNYLALGQAEKARPELIRAHQRQQEAVRDNARRIERVQQEVQAARERQHIETTLNHPMLREQMATHFGSLDRMQAYADYVNPFTVFLDGLYFLHFSAGGSDLERARKSFERVAAFTGGNDYLSEDLAAVDAAFQGRRGAPTTYVIFETGCAPIRDQVRIDLPILVIKLSYVGVAFPRLAIQGPYVPALEIGAGGRTVNTVLLASMDSIVGLDFKNELPIIITKTVASTVAKAVATYAINEAAGPSDSWTRLVAQIGTAIAGIALNVADTRTWTTLPKEFQYARVPTPLDRRIEVAVPATGQKTMVTLGEGEVNLVYVRSVSNGAPLWVSHMTLK
ncbi:MAG: hypothetical protein JXQ71_12645 [Verrucomicrobia bacterium]|nr:hypothetical protein [Verrucomicrobiota bacterium]